VNFDMHTDSPQITVSKLCNLISSKLGMTDLGGCIQKFPDWPRGVRTANDTTVCH
jgi:hypothetical protein